MTGLPTSGTTQVDVYNGIFPCIMVHMGSNLVAQAKKPPIQVRDSGNGELEAVVEKDEVRRTAARLIAAGFKKKDVAKALGKRLVPGTSHTDPEMINRNAYLTLLRWIRTQQSFRDLIYEEAVIGLDLDSPQILKGVSRAAKRGRVDAARLALELTGRHTPSTDSVVANVTVQIANIPRPED